MPIVRKAKPKREESMPATIKQERPPAEPDSHKMMVMAQLSGQNTAIAHMLRSLTGQRLVEATVQRNAQGMIETIRMTVDPA
jgi:hypothetical protein